jgi:hypothetical protein
MVCCMHELIIHIINVYTACPAGTYLSPSNNSCSTCPANSVSEEEGLAQCTCLEGYYRTPGQEEEDLPCTCKYTLAIATVIVMPYYTIANEWYRECMYSAADLQVPSVPCFCSQKINVGRHLAIVCNSESVFMIIITSLKFSVSCNRNHVCI